jgi:hypothetical protein
MKTLEKINIKGNRNSRKIEKAISAQVGRFSPARASPVPDRWAPPVGANQRAHSSPSISLSRGPVRSALFLSRAPAPSLSVCPAVPTCQPVSNLSPTISPLWTHPRPRVLRPRPSPRALLAHLPSLICALCPAPSTSLSLCLREPRALPPPADVHRLFHGCRCARAPSSATVSFVLPSTTRDTLRCAFSLSVASGPRSLERFLVQPESATVATSSLCASAVSSQRQRFCSR